MLSLEIQTAVSVAIEKKRKRYVPRRTGVKLKHPNALVTGNLKFNAIKMLNTEDTIVVYVDESIAPYMPYTNEPWTSPKWKGAKNPNENWFEKFATALARQLARELGGKLKIKG